MLFTIESSADAVLLARGSNTVALGVYAAAANIVLPLMILPQTYRQIILPIMTAWYHTQRERAFDIYRQSTRLALIVTLLLATSVALVADQIVPILFKDHFAAAVPVLQILIWSFVFASLLVPNGRLLLVTGRQSAVVPIQCASLLLNLGLNFLLQPTDRRAGRGDRAGGLVGADICSVFGVSLFPSDAACPSSLAGPAGPDAHGRCRADQGAP